jgi:hypothetical protein
MARNRSLFRSLVRLLALPAAFWLAATAGNAADISIVSPRDKETIHDNFGNVTVTVRATLTGRQRIRLLLDGAPVGTDTNQLEIPLEGIDRGEHMLEALLVDDKDLVHATSQTITFYMWRASSQLPGRAQKPKPPPQPDPTPQVERPAPEKPKPPPPKPQDR